MKFFCENYDLKNLIKQPTCYESLSNPTNVPRSFQITCVIETGPCDLHMMI